MCVWLLSVSAEGPLCAPVEVTAVLYSLTDGHLGELTDTQTHRNTHTHTQTHYGLIVSHWHIKLITKHKQLEEASSCFFLTRTMGFHSQEERNTKRPPHWAPDEPKGLPDYNLLQWGLTGGCSFVSHSERTRAPALVPVRPHFPGKTQLCPAQSISLNTSPRV